MARPDTPNLRREEILTAAAALFQQRGYSGATMRGLAEQCDLEAASLYNYFDSKQGILAAICSLVADAYLGPLAAVEESPGTYFSKVEALLRLHVRLAESLGPALTVASHDYRHMAHEPLQAYLQSRRLYEKRFEVLLTKGMAAGEFALKPPRLVLLTLLAAVRWVEHPPRNRPQTTGTELEDTIISTLMHGIAV